MVANFADFAELGDAYTNKDEEEVESTEWQQQPLLSEASTSMSSLYCNTADTSEDKVEEGKSGGLQKEQSPQSEASMTMSSSHLNNHDNSKNVVADSGDPERLRPLKILLRKKKVEKGISNICSKPNGQ